MLHYDRLHMPQSTAGSAAARACLRLLPDFIYMPDPGDMPTVNASVVKFAPKLHHGLAGFRPAQSWGARCTLCARSKCTSYGRAAGQSAEVTCWFRKPMVSAGYAPRPNLGLRDLIEAPILYLALEAGDGPPCRSLNGACCCLLVPTPTLVTHFLIPSALDRQTTFPPALPTCQPISGRRSLRRACKACSW